MANFFSDFFDVSPVDLDAFGAFDISLVADLPLFVDPFLLFNSKKSTYQTLHAEIIKYLVFLKEKSRAGHVSDALLKGWYCFPEIKQTWFGFSALGNEGHGLGMDFARALHGSLSLLFPEFGQESVTKGSHLEKVCLIKAGVGRDNISDFSTNLIKRHLLDFTEQFADKFLLETQRRRVCIPTVTFNYDTEVWEPRTCSLPWANGDYLILTPKDMLTRDENWINRTDLVHDFERIPTAVPDQQLRAQVANYFEKALRHYENREPSKKERAAAAVQTIREFPELIDYYILLKESEGGRAERLSAEKVRFSQVMFNEQVQALQAKLTKDQFYTTPTGTFAEARTRLAYLKHVIEDQGGYRFFYKDGKPLQYEKDLQIMFRLVWFGTPSDVTSEANDGRGPADFKISRGARDKTIVEMKLAKSTALRRNLEHQTRIYQAASDAERGIKVIIYFSADELFRLTTILDELGLADDESVVLIDARSDNKPSGSKAG